MNRLNQAFTRVESSIQRKAFIPFITAGDPSLEFTEKLIYMLADMGVNLIEIGIPFSDPVAEGPVIQRADERALKIGVTTDKIMAMVERARKKTDIPLAYMTYMNPIYVYGVEQFMSECARVGIDAVIVPDVPFEERMDLIPICRSHNIKFISFISPTSKGRIEAIAKEAEGFLYCVSSLGVTGERGEILGNVGDMIEKVKSIKEIPCAIGFGISTPEQAKAMASISDGVIVGSAIVRIIEEYGEEALPQVRQFVDDMMKAIN